MDCDCGIRLRRTPPHVRLLRTRPRPTDEHTFRAPVWGSFGSQAVLSVSGDLQLHTSKRATPASETRTDSEP